MIDEATLERAMKYLAETDAEGAELKADVSRSEYMAKVAESLAFTQAEGNNEERKAYARTAEPVRKKWEEHFSAVKAYEIVRARRERADLVIQVWRSENANRRLG